MQKTVTLEDIARQAGVSPSTVSRVLNGSKHVAEDKRALVLAAVEQHHYRPNAVARAGAWPLDDGRRPGPGHRQPFLRQDGLRDRAGLDRAAYRPMLTTTHWRAENPED